MSIESFRPLLDTTVDAEDEEPIGGAEPVQSPEKTTKLTPVTLTNESAAEHVRSYQAGLKARKTLDSGKATRQQRVKLEREVFNGEESAQKLVESMVKLCSRIVREIAESRHGREGAAKLLEDLMGEANMTVLEAAKEFNPAKKVAFNRWAAQRVRNTIRSIVMEEHDGGLKIYASWSRMRRRAIPERHDLALKLGREPSLEELKAHMLEVCLEWAYDHLTPEEQALSDEKRREAAMSKLRKQGTLSALENLESAISAGARPLRLDVPINIDLESGDTYGNMLADPKAGDTAHRSAAHDELKEVIMESLSQLKDREKTIILYRFGFVDGEQWTYRQIGNMFNISAERVRQIDEHIRQSLREHSDHSDRLKEQLYPDG